MSVSASVTSSSYDNLATANSVPAIGRRVLVSIPTGFQLRQFIHSGVVDMLLRRGVQVSVVSPNQPGEGFARELTKKGVQVLALDLKTGPWCRRYWAARQHLLLNGPPTATLRQKKNDLRRRYWEVALAAQVGNQVLRNFPWLRRKVLRWERLILQDGTLNRLLSDKQFDLVLLGSPGYELRDAFLLHAAVHYGIPVIAAILSWDNLTSKGFINPQPDRLLVWSAHMRDEAMNLYGIAPDRLIETGTAVHDVFAHVNRFGTRSENLQRLGLDPKRRTIFYGTNHGAAIVDEVEVVRQIAQWVEQDVLGYPCQLWVRLHPQAIAGPYSVPLEPYRELASSLVKIEFPPVYASNLLWELPKEDLEHLVGLLRDADVVINTGSLSVDAAILDRPVICLAYDPSGDLPYDRSVKRYYSYTHMLNLTQCGAVQLASSAADMRKKITTYLAHPELDREGRQRLVTQQFGRVDGHSAERIVNTVLGMLSSKTREVMGEKQSLNNKHDDLALSSTKATVR